MPIYLGVASGLIALLVLFVIVKALMGKRSLWEFWEGADHRASTSKFQVFVWTALAIFAYVGVATTTSWIGGAIQLPETLPYNLLIAMGLAVGTGIGAKVITSVQVADGTIVKTDANAKVLKPADQPNGTDRQAVDDSGLREQPNPPNGRNGDRNRPAPPRHPASSVTAGTPPRAIERVENDLVQAVDPERPPSWRYLILDDDGRPDLGKLQLMSWTMIGVVLYGAEVFLQLTDCANTRCTDLGVPDIDNVLMVLMGISQAAYLGPKLVPTHAPRLTGCVPDAANEDTPITLIGAGLGDNQNGSTILIDDLPSGIVVLPTTDVGDPWSDTQVTLRLPARHPSGTAWTELTRPTVSLGVMVAGQKSNAVQITYQAKDGQDRDDDSSDSARPSGLVRSLNAGLARSQHARVGEPFVLILGDSGEQQEYRWLVRGLPRGLWFDPDIPAITGTPAEHGEFPVEVTVIDAGPRGGSGVGLSFTDRIVIDVEDAPAQTLALDMPLAYSARVGELFEVELQAAGGVAPYRWQVDEGSLPPGLRFDHAVPAIVGAPTAPGEFPVEVTVSDSSPTGGPGSALSSQITIRVDEAEA